MPLTSSPTNLPEQGSLFQEPAPNPVRRGIERCFDVSFVAELALKEKQVQQNVRPVIAIHKWFARRPGTLFRALLLSEFRGGDLRREFFRAHDFPQARVADPFMGGGTPLLEANRLGFDVAGWDINPMAYWIVRQAIHNLDLTAYSRATAAIGERLEQELGSLYRTSCGLCHQTSASVKYFLWCKVIDCEACGFSFDLLPSAVIAEARRHPRHVLACNACGELTEASDPKAPVKCSSCDRMIKVTPARSGRSQCPRCDAPNKFPRAGGGPPRHRMLALEYHCSHCRPRHEGRFFKKPDGQDLAQYESACERLAQVDSIYIPDDAIPDGDETARLHRWGYTHYRQMFNARQLLGLHTLCTLLSAESGDIRDALATNLSDLLRYQNMLCRYDSTVLKSLDIFSIHGFPIGLIQCESNLLGLRTLGNAAIGSGGWTNIVDKFLRAKQYCRQPFEISYSRGGKRLVSVPGEWIGDISGTPGKRTRQVDLVCGTSEIAELPPNSLDAVMTDPPYFGNVQYAELMDFCYVWLRRLAPDEPALRPASTRNPSELTGNVTMERGLDHFSAGLSTVFCQMAKALKQGAPFAFTYHHNRFEAYLPLAAALLDARLVCTIALPCPAEMAGSIHIHRSESSIVDTVFTCRSTGVVFRSQLACSTAELAALVHQDLATLQAGSVTPSLGDARCVTFGHLIRLAIWRLRTEWDPLASWAQKRDRVAGSISSFGGWEAIKGHLDPKFLGQRRQPAEVREAHVELEGEDEIPF
jgi:putative DNA methylase